MRQRSKLLSALSVALVACLAVVWPAAASGDVDEQIRALESQVEQLKSQQMEMMKEATEAAEKMPTFSYRPGSGLNVAAADKSWSWNLSYRLDLNSYNTIGAKSNYDSNGNQVNTNAENLKLVARRARVYNTFCWQDCFYQYNFTMDGEGSGGEARFRDNELQVHFEQLNPWLPYFTIGPRIDPGETYISRSSSSDVKMEHPMVLNGFGWEGDDGIAGIGLDWKDLPIGPGAYRMYLNWATNQGGFWDNYNDSDRSGLIMFVGGKPFSNTKSKWISGLDIGLGYQGKSMVLNSNGNPQQVRPRIRNDMNRKNRQDFWRVPSSEVGSGWGQLLAPGLKWQIGPYFLRYVYLTTGYDSANSGNGASGVNGRGWTLDHQLNLWSPKGWFTGAPRSANSIVVGTGIERADVNCGNNCNASNSSNAPSGTNRFHRNHITTTYIGMWYYVSRGLGVGIWWNHFISTNTPEQAQIATGCKKNYASVYEGKGLSRTCTFDDINMGLRYRW